MAGVCAAPKDLGLVKGLLASVDCNVGVLTERGYAALTSPDSQVAMALTALLTLYVAFLGIRMMMGHAPVNIGGLAVSAAKVGVVLALATSWPLFQHLVVDVLTKGPQELAAAILGATGASGDPFDALQSAYGRMQVGADFFVQKNGTPISPMVGGNAFGAFALNISSVVMLLATLGVVLAAKIVLALLLALAPLFVGFLLFDATRGVFEGWLRAAIGMALAPLFATFALVVQLSLVEPHLAQLAELQASGRPEVGPAVAILTLTLISTMVSLAGVLAAGVVAKGLKLPGQKAATPADKQQPQTPAATEALPAPAASEFAPSQSRAASVAGAATDRRDNIVVLERADASAPASPPPGSPEPASYAPLGHGFRRSTQPKRAASSARRDR